MKKKSLWLWILIVVVVIGGGWFLFGRSSGKDVEYRFDEVKKGDIAIVVTATGTLEAVTTVQVGSQVSGTIAKLFADFNTVVRAGNIIAQLDPTFLEAQVKENEANLERANAQVSDSKRIFDRSSELFKKGLISQAEFDAARTTFETQSATVKQTQAALDRSRVNLKYATIRAPIDGVVISRNVDVGQTVAASFSAPVLFVIANDLTKMQVQASVDEADIGRISLGQDVTFTVDAYPEERFTGRVSEIRLQPNNVQNVINYTVIIDVPNDDLKLMPGMTANVTVLIDEKENVLRVPSLALRFMPPDISEDERKKIMASRGGGEKISGINGGSTTPSMDGKRDQSPGMKKTRESHDESSRHSAEEKKSNATRRGTEFKPFNRQQMTSLQNGNESTLPARVLPNKWKRSVSTYQRRESSGSVWILDENKKPKAISVRTGLSDGMFTEITSGNLSAGEKIIVGSIVKNDAPSSQTNPFGGQPQRPGGGRRQGF